MDRNGWASSSLRVFILNQLNDAKCEVWLAKLHVGANLKTNY